MPAMDERRRMSMRCLAYVRGQALIRPFTQVAHDVGVDEKTVRTIAGERIAQLNATHKVQAPELLAIDEAVILQQRRAILTDISHSQIIELLGASSRTSVAQWLSKLEDRERIEAVAMPMSPVFRDAVRKVLPDTTIVVDKVQAMVAVRQQFAESPGLLPRSNRALTAPNQSDLDPAPKCGQLPLTREASERFLAIWDSRTKREAAAALDRWVNSVATVRAYRPLVTAFCRWRSEILAAWDYPLTDAYSHPLANVLTLGARPGRGHTFGQIRARVLFGTWMSDQELMICQVCLARFESARAATYLSPAAHLSPARHGTSAAIENRITLCSICHEHLTSRWFKRAP
jgi:transposase